MWNRARLDGERANLDWISRPTPPPSPLSRLWSAVRAWFGRRFAGPDSACPYCLRPLAASAVRCPHCREQLHPDDPVAALSRLGVEWPTAEVTVTPPTDLPAIDPERLRLRELMQEELLGAGDAFAVLHCLNDPRIGSAIERYPHQLDTVRRVLGEMGGRALLADEVGLGKTIEAGLILAELRARGLCSSALVIAPPALLDQWQEELSDRFGLPVTRVRHPDEWQQAPEVGLISLFSARGGRQREAILRRTWDLVILDEAHHVRNRRSQGHRMIRSLRTRYLLLLSATPLQSSVMDLYSLVGLVRPALLGTPQRFRLRFGVSPDGGFLGRPRQLRGVLREAMVRNRRATAGIALPPRRAAIRWVDLGADERLLHTEVLRALRADAAHARDQPFGRTATLQRRLTSTPRSALASLSTLTDSARQRMLAELVKDAGAGEKGWALREIAQLYPEEQILVFSEFPESVEAAAQHLHACGESVIHWHGRLGGEARGEALAAFRSGARRILVGTDALAEGQNLQHCRIVVNLDLPWNPFQIEQRIGRVHRLGQRREVFVISLVARDTFEADLARLFAAKLHLFELSVGELDPVLGDLIESEAAFEDLLLRIALADDADRERELAGFARTLEDGYLRYRDAARRQEALPDLSVRGDER